MMPSMSVRSALRALALSGAFQMLGTFASPLTAQILASRSVGHVESQLDHGHVDQLSHSIKSRSNSEHSGEHNDDYYPIHSPDSSRENTGPLTTPTSEPGFVCLTMPAPEDQEVIRQAIEPLAPLTKWKKFKLIVKGMPKDQAGLAMVSIFGEALIAVTYLHDASGVTDGLLAAPTVVLAMGMGFLHYVSHGRSRQQMWREQQTNSMDLVTALGQLTVASLLTFTMSADAVGRGLEKPERFGTLTGLHFGFLGVNILQGILESLQSGDSSLGTQTLKQKIKVVMIEWGMEAAVDLAEAFYKYTFGTHNFIRLLFGRILTTSGQRLSPSTRKKYKQLTTETFRMVLAQQLLDECEKDTDEWLRRTARVTGETVADCRRRVQDAANDKTQHDILTTGLGDDRKGLALVASEETYAKLVGDNDEGSNMMKTIVFDAIGNIIPGLLFLVLFIVTQLNWYKHTSAALLASWANFFLAIFLQMYFIKSSTMKFLDFFKSQVQGNPVAIAIVREIKEQYTTNGNLQRFYHASTSIKPVVISLPESQGGYSQVRWVISQCPEGHEEELKQKLTEIAKKHHAYQPHVFLDTPDNLFGQEWSFHNPTHGVRMQGDPGYEEPTELSPTKRSVPAGGSVGIVSPNDLRQMFPAKADDFLDFQKILSQLQPTSHDECFKNLSWLGSTLG